jgi:hypothetical protein
MVDLDAFIGKLTNKNYQDYVRFIMIANSIGEKLGWQLSGKPYKGRDDFHATYENGYSIRFKHDYTDLRIYDGNITDFTFDGFSAEKLSRALKIYKMNKVLDRG